MFTGYEINAANGATLLEYEDKDENGKTLLHSYYFFKDNLCYKIDLYPADEVGIYSFIGWFDNEYNKAKDGVWLILNNQENIIKVTFESDNHGVFFSYVRYD